MFSIRDSRLQSIAVVLESFVRNDTDFCFLGDIEVAEVKESLDIFFRGICDGVQDGSGISSGIRLQLSSFKERPPSRVLREMSRRLLMRRVDLEAQETEEDQSVMKGSWTLLYLLRNEFSCSVETFLRVE